SPGTCDPATGVCSEPTNLPNVTGCSGGGVCCNGVCCAGCCGSDGSCGARRVFVTSTVHDWNLGDLAGADALCQTRAPAGGLPGAYLAWLSDSTIWPAARFRCRAGECSQGYIRVDGVVVANDWDDLIDGNLANPISVSELNTTVAAPTKTWTATFF